MPHDFGNKCSEHNYALLASLREDEHASSLLELTRADAKLGRMSSPVPGVLVDTGVVWSVSLLHALSVTVEECDLDIMLLHPRFAAVQGMKCVLRPACDHAAWGQTVCMCVPGREDGTLRLRTIDNFSWSKLGNSKKKRKAESINGYCTLPEKVQHDHLDSVIAASRLFLQCAW